MLGVDAPQFAEGMRSGDPIDLQPMRRLEAADRALGEGSVPTIDRPRAEPVATELPLQSAYLRGPNAGVTRSRKQDARRRAQGGERGRTGDAISAQAMSALE
jgi:hypothetical protein